MSHRTPPHRRSRTRVRPLALTAALLALLAWTLIGIRPSFAIVQGNSMEPAISDGDVVVTVRSERYVRGDVVLFDYPGLGPLVHRVVGEEDGRLLVRGDHNAVADAFRPFPDQVRGRMVVAVPRLGVALDTLRTPAVAGLLVGGALALSLLQAGRARAGGPGVMPWTWLSAGSRPGARGGRGRAAARRWTTPSRGGLPGGTARSLAGTLAVLALAGVALLTVVALAGTTRRVREEVPYTHAAVLEYESAARGGVFDGDVAATGAPIYRALSDRVDLRVAYRLDAPAADGLAGRYDLAARVGLPNGWSREIPLAAGVPFEGAAAVAAGTLDLARVDDLIRVLERETGVQSQAYELTVVAAIEVTGQFAGRPLADRFEAAFAFVADAQQVQVVRRAGGGSPLEAARGGSVSLVRAEPQTLPFLAGRVRTTTLRAVALAMLIAALGGGAVLARAALGDRGASDEVARIRARHGDVLVPARLDHLPEHAALVTVERFESLVTLAELHAAAIFDAGGGRGPDGADAFFLVVDGTAFVYRPPAAAAAPRALQAA